MNVKNFIVGGIVGGIAHFLLGWLFYGMLFADQFGGGNPENMVFIFLGCMTFGFFVSYIFNQWAQISTGGTGAKAGAIIGLFMGLFNNFFANSTNLTPNYNLIGLDIVIMIVMSAIIGGIVGFTMGKMK
jgi:hypothetical protein